MDILFSLESMEDFTAVLRDVFSSLNDTNCRPKSSLEANKIKSIKEDLMKLLTNSNFVMEKVKENLLNKCLDSQRVDTMMSILDDNKTELLYSTLLMQYSCYGETVTDFNWVLKLVMGTSDLKSLRYPLLQLVLSTIGNGESKQRIYDVNKDMLAKMIQLLETIQ